MKKRRKAEKRETTPQKVRAFVELFSQLGITFQDVVDEYSRICLTKEKYGRKSTA